jgi:TonB family protein
MRGSALKQQTRSAEVIAVPSRPQAKAEPSKMPVAPEIGERPTLAPASFRDWLRVAIIVSVALHLIVFLALQLKFADDLERAAGAAAALSSDGTIVIPIEVVVEAALPPAPAPTNASDAQAKIATPSPPREIESMQAPQAPAAFEVIERKTRPSTRASTSAAASPARAAASGSAGRAGASGETEFGGRATASSYQAQVLAHLSRYRIYPPEAQSRGITGVSTVRFALAPDGQVLASSLARGSGAAMLDEAAVAMVRRASPFPPFPPGLGRARMDFAAPIRFDLR